MHNVVYKSISFACIDPFHRFQTTLQLVSHLSATHHMKMDTRTLSFSNMNEFLQWKEKEERATNSSYVKHSSSKLYGENEHSYYYCNRTGSYTGKGEGKRQLKSQGSSKINSHCTAHMKAVYNRNSHKVSVEHCATHHSHNIQLGHLRMPNEV